MSWYLFGRKFRWRTDLKEGAVSEIILQAGFGRIGVGSGLRVPELLRGSVDLFESAVPVSFIRMNQTEFEHEVLSRYKYFGLDFKDPPLFPVLGAIYVLQSGFEMQFALSDKGFERLSEDLRDYAKVEGDKHFRLKLDDIVVLAGGLRDDAGSSLAAFERGEVPLELKSLPEVSFFMGDSAPSSANTDLSV